MKAIVVAAEHQSEIRDVPVPSVPEGALLVKVTALAVNPTDWKHVEYGLADVGARCGCDYAGVVEELGPGAEGFEKGDRVFGFSHGGNRVNHQDGAFAEYVIAKPGPRAKTPDNISDVEAASLGVAITTVGQGLYKLLELPFPNAPAPKPFPILIYGGSTATGVIGIQLAKLSGLTVITTASPRNHDYLGSLGADLVVDYSSPTAVQQLRDFAGGPVGYAWDCIGLDDSQSFCEAAVQGHREPRIGSILLSKHGWTLGYDGFGETYEWIDGEIRHGDPGELEFCKRFWEVAREILAKGGVKPIRQRLNYGGSGLEGVLEGMKGVKEGIASAEKLVYTM